MPQWLNGEIKLRVLGFKRFVRMRIVSRIQPVLAVLTHGRGARRPKLDLPWLRWYVSSTDLTSILVRSHGMISMSGYGGLMLSLLFRIHGFCLDGETRIVVLIGGPPFYSEPWSHFISRGYRPLRISDLEPVPMSQKYNCEWFLTKCKQDPDCRNEIWRSAKRSI